MLLRDAKINYYEKLLENPTHEETLQQQLDAETDKLHADFAFIATCNVGSEFMDDEQLARLKDVACIKWHRHFDATLGLSPLEEMRFADLKRQSLPVEETLLKMINPVT